MAQAMVEKGGGGSVAGPREHAAMRKETVRQVARLCAAAAITAPKSGGQLLLRGARPFLETVIVDERETLASLAAWMRRRAQERQEAIWLRDAEVAERVDAVLFIGLKDAYPPNYDCGACGFATCVEFLRATAVQRRASARLEFEGPLCTLRAVDLGVAVGSAAKSAALYSIDARCQTRIAVAARHLGVIESQLAVALSLSLTHKSIGFDLPLPELQLDQPAPTPTGVLPVGAPGHRCER